MTTVPGTPVRALLRSFLPRSLMGRVFGLFTLTMLIFLGTGLGMFYRYQFIQHIEETQDNALTLVEVAAQTIEDSAVIGDYDTVQRTLNKMLLQSPFKSAEFLDVSGGVIRLRAPQVTQGLAPQWLTGLIAAKLYDVNRVANVGGKDYGVVRLSFDERKLAAQMWVLLVETALVTGIVFALSLVVMRTLLRRWLDNLGGLRSYEHDVAAGVVTAEAALNDDAPIEIQEAIQAVNRSAASMRVQFGQRIDSLMNSLMQHKSAMDQAAIVCELDAEGRVVEVNELFVANSGFARAEVVGRPLAEVGQAAGIDAWRPSRQVWNGEVVVAGRNGVRQWHRTVVPMFDAAGVVERYICIDIDISERKEFERAIVENAARQTLIAEFGRKALGADGIEDLFADAADVAMRGLGASCAATFEAGGANEQYHVTLRAGAGHLTAAQGFRLAFPGGPLQPQPQETPLRPWLAPLADLHGLHSGVDACIICADNPIGFIGAYSDGARRFGADDLNFLRTIANILATAVERHDAKNRLTYLAQYDALTDLPNRRHLALSLEQAIGEAGRQGHRAGVMFIDLDRFKNVNDMLGHGVGDQLLVLAAKRLRACARDGALVARLGGDEFALVLPRLAGNDAAAALAGSVIEALAQPFYLQGQQLFVSASVGIASFPEDGADAELLLKSADTAMYEAKNNGRNNYQFYAAAMHEGAARRLQLEAQLRQALERREFLLHYQPKLDLASGSVSGFEALLRWQHPQRGLVPPLEFIAILEDTGLITAVGEWVIGEVCRQLKEWEAQGLPLPRVAINLSARQLEQDDLAGTIERIVHAAGVAPALLEFELTESMLMSNPEAAVEILERIKALGMRLSVDDFGTGYSSLAYLKRFPLDALKIDRTFVRDLPHDSDDAAITMAVIRLAHSLNLKVVAEGVEDIAQLRELEKYNCNEIQGYYFSRPLPAAACTALLLGEQPLAA
ncbi:EAL domain-containing protein [Massilia forsythiae]|uniref:EAL domain-containing protein n=1 Tax=Massilia forsythiae TaxID=2728020 RepID=A0A7Z2VYR2_9BURK|nr:EAL domain-containing protein [Massilia forsythiae]QJE01746.1 EAL domain-containing protein [Massilia forsythiae]